MANRRRKMTTLEEIEAINEEISVKESELDTLKARKKELLEKRKSEELEELYKIIVKSGKSIDDVRAMVEGQ